VTDDERPPEEIPAASAEAGNAESEAVDVESEAADLESEAAPPAAEAGDAADVESDAAPPAQEPAGVDESAAAAADRRKSPRGSRPSLEEERDPVVRDERGYRLRIEPRDLVKLRELPGSKGKSDRELGEQFFDGQAGRLAASLDGDVDVPADVRVVVDPYSRQAFLAVGRTIRGIVSF